MTYDLSIGAAHVTQITEVARWPFAPHDLFPNIEERHLGQARENLVGTHFDLVSGELILAIHTYVIDVGDTEIVVDTGNGNDKERPSLLPHHQFKTKYLERFTSAGHCLDDIDIVLNTHLHPDHCGWNTHLVDEAWVPTFQSATYLFSEDELNDLELLATTPGLNDGIQADLAQTYQDSVRPVLEHSRWTTLSGETLIAQHDNTTVVAVPTPGHSRGHLVVEIRVDDRPRAVISGDVIHHPLQLIGPDLTQGGDDEPKQAKVTRDALLKRCAEQQILLLTAHFAGDGPMDLRDR